jgi:hypothetical protein
MISCHAPHGQPCGQLTAKGSLCQHEAGIGPEAQIIEFHQKKTSVETLKMNFFKIIVLMGTLIALSACGDKDETTDSGETSSDSGEATEGE